jgi:competence CoiA-like predicted nuclease
MCSKCPLNVSSQYAYLQNKEYLHIHSYINNIDNINYQYLCCGNGHELICANGPKNKPHFRHKNPNDVGGRPMSDWHSEWQSQFPITEIEFNKISDQQIKSRRTDALLNDTTVLEFQHSLISRDDVNNRNNDYKLHNKNVIWIIDGNKGINVRELSYSKRVYLEFISDVWKFENFIDCEFIYIDIQDAIYKVFPHLIKSNMTDVQQPISKELFIDYLLHNRSLFTEPEPSQCKLFIKQQGAGNGKTYGIIKMLESEDFKHYKYFIYITKQHSAVHVIFNEFSQQIKLGNLTYLQIESEPILVNKKYIIKYLNLKTNNACQIIIGTIDSLMYALGNKNHTEFDRFEGLVNSIIDEHIETITKCGTINYSSLKPKLSKETMMIGDEMQDLKISYAKAIIQIMRNRYIDVYIVGDTLQSISYENNAFTYLLDNEFAYIDTQVFPYTNVCHRFSHPKLVAFVNKMIPFEKYKLPIIQTYSSTYDASAEPIIIFKGSTIYGGNDKDENKINIAVEQIMKYYEQEVNKYARLPEDFLIVTPYTQRNPLVDALQLAINIYWTNKIEDASFQRYAIFHKSEEGSSINLNESTNATRIVSIHSSKGDGRKVAFVIGLNEIALNSFSGITNNLIYDSLFHVSITRMKEKLYIRCDNYSDDISTKMQQYLHETGFIDSDIEPTIPISNSIKYNNLISSCKTTMHYQLFEEPIFNMIQLQPLNDTRDEKEIIDTSHHNIRYASIMIHIYLQIILNENIQQNVTKKKQIIAIFYGIVQQGITETDTWKGYNILLKDRCIPILKMTDKGRDYIQYYNIILNLSKNLLVKLTKIINSREEYSLCPMECVILYYMIETSRKGIFTDINISELYNIIDIYNKCFDNTITSHNHCLCKTCFNVTNKTIQQNEKCEGLKEYIYCHYEKIQKITTVFKQCCIIFPNMNWLTNHAICFNGQTDEFNISKRYPLIGYDDNTVLIAYIKPQFNKLNYNQTLMDSVFDTYLVQNVKNEKDKDEKDKNKDEKDKNKNYKQFYNKNVICVVFSTDLDEIYYINWTNIKNVLLEIEPAINNIITNNHLFIQNTIKTTIKTTYLFDTTMIYNFYKYWRKHCPEDIKSPSNIIYYILDKLDNVKKAKGDLPAFITSFFNDIKFKISYLKNDKKAQTLVLKEYDNKHTFITYLEEILDISLNRYFGIKTNDDDVGSDAGFVSDDDF